MRILLISTSFSGLTQRYYTELDDAGFQVSVELHFGDIPQLIEGVELFKPDLILCPFLTKKLPVEIYGKYKCLIVHPGIKGDRGPSSLDWAIQNNIPEWGVSLLEAAEEMDAGAIWAHKTFPMRSSTKSSIFYREVTQAAVDCLWEALTYFDAPDFKPEIQDYSRADYQGKLMPLMKQEDRAINWQKNSTEEIVRRINAADGSPGVLDVIYGMPVLLFNAHKETQLTGKAGEIIATANHAICRATIDGAVWIGHFKPKLSSAAKGIKLPATYVLKDLLPEPTPNAFSLKGLLSKTVRAIEIDYTKPGRQLPCQEVWFELDNDIVYIFSSFHNGGMSTEQCQLLLTVYQHVQTLPIKAIVLMGGEDNWSNGIHLNHIETADSPADESWLNINAINDLIYQIINTMDKLTIAAVSGNAGAGGAILALAADKIFVREGVLFNPHYKNMGELYGSEYWTYLLPKRVGQKLATRLTEQRLPISAKRAWRMGLIDKVLDKNHQLFFAQIKNLVKASVADSNDLKKALHEKAKARCYDESLKPLATYRKFELTQMYENFYGNDQYHRARQNFVYKMVSDNTTPLNIAKHRQNEEVAGMLKFVWQEQYRMGDDVADKQHKDIFVIVEQLVCSINREQLVKNSHNLYQHIKEHFFVEEDQMEQSEYFNLKTHVREHNQLLDMLARMDQEIANNNWHPDDLQEFMDFWIGHIFHSDMAFNVHRKDCEPCRLG